MLLLHNFPQSIQNIFFLWKNVLSYQNAFLSPAEPVSLFIHHHQTSLLVCGGVLLLKDSEKSAVGIARRPVIPVTMVPVPLTIDPGGSTSLAGCLQECSFNHRVARHASRQQGHLLEPCHLHLNENMATGIVLVQLLTSNDAPTDKAIL